VSSSADNFARAEVFGAIQRDQHPPAQALEGSEHALGFDGLVEQRIERDRWGTIQHQTDIAIRWNSGDAEQGLTIRPAVALLQRALMRQERWTSHEEQRERGRTDIRHRITADPRRSAPVGKTGADLTQSAEQGLQRVHGATESGFAPRRQPKSSDTVEVSADIHQLLHFGLAQAQARTALHKGCDSLAFRTAGE